MDTPSMTQVIVCGAAEIAVAVFLIRYIAFFVADWWRLRPGRHEHEGCYGRGDSCNVKFITGGRG